MVLLTDPRLRRFAAATYLLGALLLLVPLIDTAAGIFPPQANRVFWRYGAAGVLSRGLLDPALGLALISVTAVVLGHERVRKTMIVLLVAGMVAIAGGLVLFLLDALQVHASVQAQMKMGFRVATGLAMLRYLMLLLLLGLLAYALRMPRTVVSGAEARVKDQRSFLGVWGKNREANPRS